MKTIFTLLLLLTFNLALNAQNLSSHQPQQPPANPGYQFVRGMYIDCADDIILDISNGSPLGLHHEMITYLQTNFVKYIVLCGLEHANIFGNPPLENALRSFMLSTRNAIPNIKIGISGSDGTLFQQTPYLMAPDEFITKCNPNGLYKNVKELNNLINASGNNSMMKVSELSKFFIRAGQFGANSEAYYPSRKCYAAFDAFYLEYKFWEFTTSMQAMQYEFNNFKNILKIMQNVKCVFNCVKSIDAQFLPTEIFMLQGWTAIDQITDADTLIDRMMIPAYTNNENGTYDLRCKTFHYISDRFSKSRTMFFVELNAESQTFSYCDNTATPNNYLGDYLNGSASHSGNMYSVENAFMNKFNDANYVCTACGCHAYIDNHWSPSNIWGNICTGAMWRSYTMMSAHNLFRERSPVKISTDELPIKYELINLNGQVVKTESSFEIFNFEIKNIKRGFYIIRKTYSDNREEKEICKSCLYD